jgi:hypothetical protein
MDVPVGSVVAMFNCRKENVGFEPVFQFCYGLNGQLLEIEVAERVFTLWIW